VEILKKVILLALTFIFLLAFCGSVAAANNTTICVSVAINGSESNGYSYEPSISSDGRYIAFSSYASNLVAGDIGHKDVFVRDRLLNTTTLVSVSSAGEQGNGDSSQPSISADGRYVAFTSYATNLVTGDTNGVSDIFVRDLLLNITERVSVSSMGEQSNGDSSSPSISGDGRYVAFSSGEARFSEARFESFNTERSSNSQHAGNLVPDDNNGFHDIFVYDRILKTIKRVSISSTGEQSNGDSYSPSISGDGRYIAFSSGANNLVTGDNNGVDDIFVYDQTLNTIKRVSISTNGDEGNGYSSKPSISANGRYIAFSSYANNLVWGDNNHRDDVFVHDQISGITERVSVSSTGEEFNVDCGEPSISGNGRYVAFSLQDIRPAGAPMGIDLPPDYSYFISQV
jgi:Tol biopolymer transport system component